MENLDIRTLPVELYPVSRLSESPWVYQDPPGFIRIPLGVSESPWVIKIPLDLSESPRMYQISLGVIRIHFGVSESTLIFS